MTLLRLITFIKRALLIVSVVYGIAAMFIPAIYSKNTILFLAVMCIAAVLTEDEVSKRDDDDDDPGVPYNLSDRVSQHESGLGRGRIERRAVMTVLIAAALTLSSCRPEFQSGTVIGKEIVPERHRKVMVQGYSGVYRSIPVTYPEKFKLTAQDSNGNTYTLTVTREQFDTHNVGDSVSKRDLTSKE